MTGKIIEALTDDKSLVIIAVTILGLVALFRLTEPEQVLTAVVSGLFGVAVGKVA